MIIRPANPADVYENFEIRTSVTENNLIRFQLAELGITVDSITEMLTDNANAWVAQDRNVITGFVIIDQTVGELSALLVRSEYQGEGIGRRLLDIAQQNLFAFHDEIHLIADGNSRAADFYLAAGWKQPSASLCQDVRLSKIAPKQTKKNL